MRATLGLTLITAGAVGVLATEPRAWVERVVSGDGVVVATIGGVEARVRIDPGATAMPLLTKEIAERAGLKPSMFGILYGVGPVRVSGASRVTRTDFGGGRNKQRVAWTKRPYAAGLDGVVGPAGLPEPVVRFALRAVRPGERTVAFRMIDQGGIMGNWAERFAVIDVGGEPMRLRFDPHHRRTLATAGAGVRLARAYGGTLAGGTTPEEIAFGIERPVRALTLATPLRLGALSIGMLGIRTADSGSATAIPDADAAPADPDEVVVTANVKRDPNRDRLALGRDQLDRCSSIVFDKPAKQVRLTCL